jgi:rhodanese-related sulfurtransferase
MKVNKQLIGLVLIAVFLGFLNNLRVRTHIPWIQKWAAFEDVARIVEPQKQNGFSSYDVETMLVKNQGQGPTDIYLDQARAIFDSGRDLTFWIDARNKELYEQGHIPGAVLLDFYDQMTYLDQVEAQIKEKSPVALVVYCRGKDCHDSHLLAQTLNQFGYDNIFVYKGGWAEWNDELGLPVEGTLDNSASRETLQATGPPVKPEPKRKGMYLEQIIRDLFPFIVGMFFVAFWKRSSINELILMLAALICGLFFIWASIPKIMSPFTFAKDIWNYDLFPGWSINAFALALPWLELLAGLGLVLGMIRPELRNVVLKGSATVLSGLLFVFLIAVSVNIIRGHEFNCGCTGDTVYFRDYFVEGWNDKYTLLLRDLGLIAMSLGCLFHKVSASDSAFSES